MEARIVLIIGNEKVECLGSEKASCAAPGSCWFVKSAGEWNTSEALLRRDEPRDQRLVMGDEKETLKFEQFQLQIYQGSLRTVVQGATPKLGRGLDDARGERTPW